MFEGLGEVLGVMLAPKMAANPPKIEKKCGSKRQAVPEWFFDGFPGKVLRHRVLL